MVASNLNAQTWTGTTSTNWNISTNWSPAAVPISTSNVTIPGSVSSGNWPAFAGNVTINSINMVAGSQLDVNGFTLTLNGVNAFTYFTSATLNNSSGGSDIVINVNTGSGGYATYFRSNTVNDAITFNITGANPFYEGDAAPANHYNGNVSFNINSGLLVYISYVAPSQYNGNLTVNRTIAGATSLFNAGGSITGNYTYTNNAGGSVVMGVTGVKTSISGTVNIAANYPSPAAFEMHRIVNQTAGGSINVQNSQGFHLEKDTLKVATLSITGYRGSWYGYLWNNAITGNVTIADDVSYTTNYATYIRSNVITGNTSFSIYGTNQFYDADVANTKNNYIGNLTYNGASTAPLYIAYGDGLQCSGNLAINRTTAGITDVFSSGTSTIGGNFAYTNNTAGNTYFGNAATNTSIAGTLNIASSYTTPNYFEMRRLINQATGGTINVQNSQGFYLDGDTLKVTTLSITGYRSSQYGDLWNNSITGNVTLADDASYTSNYITRIRSNAITGNTSFSINGTNQFFDADIPGTGNKYIGNVAYNAAGGPVYIAYSAPLQCSGNLAINRTSTGTTYAFITGSSTINGNFTYANNVSGLTFFGNDAAKTSIAGTVNITANYSTPSAFEMHHLVNQTGGGSISLQRSLGFDVRNDTLIVNAISLTGYHGNAYAYFVNNAITGNVTTADSSVYTGGYATYIQNCQITGNCSFTNKGTNSFYDAPSGGTGNHYIGNVTFNGAGSGTLFIAYIDAMQCSGNLTINRTAAGITNVFATGTSNVNGNFSYTNNTAGNTAFGNLFAKTNITGTINITANYTSPNSFEMYRLSNQTGGGSINVQNSLAFNVQNDTLIVNTLSLTGYRGNAYTYFYNNAITGNVTTADDASYSGGYAAYFRSNKITGNTSITNNGTNVFYDSDAGASGNKYIGNVTYIRNGGSISVAAGDSIEVSKNLTLNSNTSITLGSVKFNGNTNGVIEQLGTQPISIPTLVMGKTGGAKLTLNDSVTVTTTANFTSGNIYSSAGNNLIFPDNISYTGASASSHVVGPVTKIGDDAFIFPVGTPTSINTVAMNAPVGTTSKFRAEYKNQNPTSDGYNTASKAVSFGSAMISKAGYWNVQRLTGATNVTLTFGFGTNPYEQYPALANLKVAHWSGAQWDDHGNGGTTGTSASGTVVNSLPITSFSPFTLAGVINTQFYTYSNPGTGPDGTPVKFGGKGGYPAYSTKQLPSGSYTLDSIFLVANGSTVGFKGKDFYGVEKDDTTITAPVAPTTYITANGNGTVNFKGWRHFVYMKDGSNKIMGAIKDNNLTLGNTTMYTYFSSADVAISPNRNIFLKRRFKITSQFAPAGTRGVRLYISKTEFTNLQAADPNSFPNGLNSLTITKYTGPQEDSIFNPIPGGNAVIIPNSAITIADLGTMYSLDINVTGFSGFYIGGNNSNLNICPGSTITLPSNISGATYQWQVDTGSGFTNLSNIAPYSGTGTGALTIANAPGSIYGNQYQCVVNGGTFSQTYTVRINVSWEGTVSSAWENPANWSCGALPDSNTDVIVNGGKPNNLQLNASTTVRTMEINAGATVTIKPGVTLQVVN